MADSNSPAFTPPLNNITQSDPPDIISVGKKETLDIGNRASQQRGLMGGNPFTVKNLRNGQ